MPRLHLKNFFLHRHRGLLSFSTVESHGLPSAFIRLPGNNIIEHIQESGNRGGDLENTVLRLEVLYEVASVNRDISLETVDLIIQVRSHLNVNLPQQEPFRGYEAPVVSEAGRRGRPKFSISE